MFMFTASSGSSRTTLVWSGSLVPFQALASSFESDDTGLRNAPHG